MNTTQAPGGDGRIAVVSQWRKGFARLPVPYTHAVEAAGGRTRVLSTFELPPLEEQPEETDAVLGADPYDGSVLDGATGLVIPGGGDIDPALYGRERHPRTHNVSNRRDRFELTLLSEALDRDIPVLAICHGMQLLNVHLGGTLIQHLPDDPDRQEHDRDRPRSDPVHLLEIEPESLLADVLGDCEARVNSHHHQGLDDVSDDLVPVAWSEDGVIEAVEAPEFAWVLGVQWHPEVMAPADACQMKLFRAFVAAAASYEGAETAATARSA